MTTRTTDKAKAAAGGSGRGKRRYDRPRLTDYGHVSKLTLTGGVTTRDTGAMKRVCL